MFGRKSSTTEAPTRKDYLRLDEKASKLHERNQLSEAEALYREALELARRITPEDKDALQMATFNLGSALYDEGRYADAEPLIAEACQINTDGFGEDDLNGELVQREKWSRVLMQLGKYDEARALFQRRLESLKRQFGHNDIVTVVPLAGLAVIARNQQPDAAEAAHESAADGVKNAPNLSDEERTDILLSLERLVSDAQSYEANEKDLFLKCLHVLESALEHGKINRRTVPTGDPGAAATTCPKCGFAIPAAPAIQPLLDKLQFDNPATLTAVIHPGESVLGQAHAYVGGIVATTERVMVLKRGQVHSFAYPDVIDLKIDRLNWMNAAAQIITAAIPERKMTPKEAQEEAPNAVAFVPRDEPLYRSLRDIILAVRVRFVCPQCGAVLPARQPCGGPAQPEAPSFPLDALGQP